MARKSDKLSPSLEDYLEAVLILVRRGSVARVRDIAAHLGVGKSSVTGAVKTLAKRGLVNYEPYQFITLSDRGRELAEEVAARHVLLREFLSDVLGLDEEVAEANACLWSMQWMPNSWSSWGSSPLLFGTARGRGRIGFGRLSSVAGRVTLTVRAATAVPRRLTQAAEKSLRRSRSLTLSMVIKPLRCP